MNNIVVFCFVFCATLCIVNAVTEDDLKAEFTKYVIRCHKENPVDMRELFKLEKLVVPTDSAVTCLLACAYKKEGLMTPQGTMNLDHANELAEMLKNGDEERLANAKKLIDVCSKVNDEPVTDGEKGCERAGFMFKCGVENIRKYGFKI